MNNKEILDQAPEGWTHVNDKDYDHPVYFMELDGLMFASMKVWAKNKWFADEDGSIPMRSRADIERIVWLERTLKEVKDLLDEKEQLFLLLMWGGDK